jgi:serine/threonine-protein kinase HipA
VDDETRQGALRFAEKEGGPFLHQVVDHRTPPLIELPALLAASEHVYDEVETAEDLRLLLAPGSSLGGARPKASVRDRDGGLAIAKFPHHRDLISTVLWEAVALRLASAAGINTATGRITLSSPMAVHKSNTMRINFGGSANGTAFLTSSGRIMAAYLANSARNQRLR